MKSLIDFLFESMNEAFSVKLESSDDSSVSVSINGHKYTYEPKEGSSKELSDKFSALLKHSPGKAVQYLKNHSILVDGSKRAEALKNKFNSNTSDREIKEGEDTELG